MIERESIDQDEVLKVLLTRKINPADAILADNVNEYLVIFNFRLTPNGDKPRSEQITVRFLKKDARDRWWKTYCERYKEVKG